MRGDPRLKLTRSLAGILLSRSLGLRSGDSVLIESWSTSLPVAQELWLAARRMGIKPTIILQPEDAFFAAQRLSTRLSPNAPSASDLAAAAACDGCIHLPGPEDTERLADLLDRFSLSKRREYRRRFAEWTSALDRRRTPAVYFFASNVTERTARTYGVPLARLERETRASARVDPQRLRATARPLVASLRRPRRLSITHPNGTWLEVSTAGQSPILQDGVVDARDIAAGQTWTSLPSGVLTVALDPRHGEGRFVANRPTRHRASTVTGFDWTFHAGSLVRAAARQGQELFERNFDRAGPERSKPASLSIGLNPENRDLPLAEDQEKGVITLLIGYNDDHGGRTRGDFREFAVLRGATVTAEGRTLIRSGHVV